MGIKTPMPVGIYDEIDETGIVGTRNATEHCLTLPADELAASP